MKIYDKKLISFDFKKAEGIICIWAADSDNERITYHTSKIWFMVPGYLITGLFDDGTVSVDGVYSLNAINSAIDYEDLFCYNQFWEYIDKFIVERMVAFDMEENGNDIVTAKDYILKQLLLSKVEMSDEAKEYLSAQ